MRGVRDEVRWSRAKSACSTLLLVCTGCGLCCCGKTVRHPVSSSQWGVKIKRRTWQHRAAVLGRVVAVADGVTFSRVAGSLRSSPIQRAARWRSPRAWHVADGSPGVARELFWRHTVHQVLDEAAGCERTAIVRVARDVESYRIRCGAAPIHGWAERLPVEGRRTMFAAVLVLFNAEVRPCWRASAAAAGGRRCDSTYLGMCACTTCTACGVRLDVKFGVLNM